MDTARASRDGHCVRRGNSKRGWKPRENKIFFFLSFPISSLQRYKKYSSANAFSCGEAVYTHADRLVTSKPQLELAANMEKNVLIILRIYIYSNENSYF